MAGPSSYPLLLLALVVRCGPRLAGAASLEALEGHGAYGGEGPPGEPPWPEPLARDAGPSPTPPALPKIRGVHYAPHQVGEPNSNVVSTVLDVYQAVYRDHHHKHLQLISSHLGANTLRVQPWDNQATQQTLTDSQLSRTPFYKAMQDSKINNLIPTFQISKHYYESMEEGQVIDHGPDSPVFQDFEAFLGSLLDFEQTFDPHAAERPALRAWSLDLAVDVKDVWAAIPPDGQVDDCSTVMPPSELAGRASPFQRYKEALAALGNRVWPRDGVPKWIKDKPLLVPLDLTEFTGVHWARTQGLLRCLTEWLDHAYQDLFSSGKAHWLLSFTLPMPNLADDIPRDTLDCAKQTRCKDFVNDGFVRYLDDLMTNTFLGAKVPQITVMLGAHALAYNTRMAYGGIAEDYGANVNGNSYVPRQQLMLRYAYQQYQQREQQAHSNLQGFIIDEWMDNWDRGNSGPFVLAMDKLSGTCGSRFTLDRGPQCRREVTVSDGGTTYFAYPESVGLAATVSQVIFHCAKPRFAQKGQPLFADGTATEVRGEAADMVCAIMIPSAAWSCVAGVVLAAALGLQCASRACRRSEPQEAPTERQPEPRRDGDPVSADCYILPSEGGLRGDHRIRLTSQHFESRDQAAWWLKCHYATQIEILERQLLAERSALQACRARAEAVRGPRGGQEPAASELEAATQTLHRRCFEGFDAWCRHVGVRRLDPERARPIQQLFAECVLMRTVESLGEHIINCPERISFLLYGIIQDAEGRAPARDVERPLTASAAVPLTYAVDLERLHDGLTRMMQNSNPYKPSNVASLIPGMGQKYNELGLNFDDINDSGIKRSPYVMKTFREPRSVFVLCDLVLSYRVTLLIKYWVLVLGFYLYLGSGQGRDVTTKHNGTVFEPQYLRVDLWYYAGLLDAGLWIVLELMVLLYSGPQRWPAWRSKIPGSPNFSWLIEHTVCLLLSVGGFIAICKIIQQDSHGGRSLGHRPESCLNSCTGDCMDVRVSVGGHYDYGKLFEAMEAPLVYWLHRFIVFYWLHRRRWPTYIYGKPDPKLAKTKDGKVPVLWVIMLACCAYLEGYWLLPVTAGLDWSNQCGLDVFQAFLDVPDRQVGVCTEHWVTSSCVPCALSVLLVWILVILCCYVDLYFIFYIFSALVGGYEGNRRKLNNLKNPGVVIDFRSADGGRRGAELELLEAAFGPGWQHLWRNIVKDLWVDSLIGLRQAEVLLEAAGVRFKGSEDLRVGEPDLSSQSRELDLASALYGCDLAAERLCFFFKSLRSITRRDRPHADAYRPELDGLTAEQLHVGSIPPVTMIIPVYNETVLPSKKSLVEGSRPDDARNQLAGGNGNGERTLPPKGDGVNRNLAFLISQFKDEWAFLAERLGHRDPNVLYASFVGNYMPDDDRDSVEICKWAALRTQTVAKTVLGALKYLRALASLPAIQEHYAALPGGRAPELHGELLLAHQTYGSRRGSRENDAAVEGLLRENVDLPFYLVFDINDDTDDEVKELVRQFLSSRFDRYEDAPSMRYARVKCCWSKTSKNIEVLEVLPRRFPLRVGHHEDFMSQGKASNQLNALLFASGHCFQALDCNMGTFMGECYKVPFVLRDFLPADAKWEPNRTNLKCRYIGFREYIFTSREGCVGQRHAAAEWTFGTIFQRFLSVLEIRMHYGHPDFLDGFWARNRGGMSKCSPVVNLSEDIFAGYNVRMREEKSPHTDVLEFEKGREATFNAASGFFAKIAGGSISVLRSRDNHILCERIGILHGLSFYFASVGFYLSNLVVDLTTYLYVIVFICFTLASISLGDLKQLDSALGTEWIGSMGLISMVPQLVEMIIELGAPSAVGKIIVSFLSSTFFFIFQNKNVSAAMKQGVITGSAKYLFTGRPTANQHQTWKDIYATYWKSHYHPGFDLLVLYIIYGLLVVQSEDGQLPMSLVIASFSTWLCGPMLFSPLPKWRLIKQDLEDFKTFINSKAGMEARAMEEVLVRASRHKCRSLYELCVADEINKWTERPLKINLVFIGARIVVMGLLLTALPAGILDFTLPFVAALGVQWIFTHFFLRGNNNNIFELLSILVWPLVPVMGHLLIGDRARVEDWRIRLPEYFISALVYFTGLGLVKRICIFVAACWKEIRISFYGVSEKEAEQGLKLAIRSCYFYYFEHQTRIFRAYLILVINLAVSVVLMLLDSHCFGFGLHTWLLLNSSVAKAQPSNGFMEGENRVSFIQANESRGSFSSFRLPGSLRRRLGGLSGRVSLGGAETVNPQEARRGGLHMRLVGPELGRDLQLREGVTDLGNVFLTFHRMMYQDLLRQDLEAGVPPPHLAVAFHAGVQMHDSWRPAVESVISRGIPMAVTGYSLSDIAAGLRKLREGCDPQPRIVFEGVNHFACSERLLVDEVRETVSLCPEAGGGAEESSASSGAVLQTALRDAEDVERAGGLEQLLQRVDAQRAEVVSINSWWYLLRGPA